MINFQAWKTSVEEQLESLHQKTKCPNETLVTVYENIRTTALGIYEQYLKDKSEHKIDVEPALVHKLFFKIKNPTEIPSENWFDDIKNAIFDKMEYLDEYLPSFKRSKSYIKLLQELDLLTQNQIEEDAISLNSLDNLDINEEVKRELSKEKLATETKNEKFVSDNRFLTVESCDKSIKHVRSLSDVTDCMKVNDKEDICKTASVERTKNLVQDTKLSNGKSFAKVGGNDFSLSVHFIETGIVCDKGKTFGIYAIQVTRNYDNGMIEQWHIYRRYSDFYDLHCRIKDKVSFLQRNYINFIF